MYKLCLDINRDGINKKSNNIIRIADQAIIPKDPANTDYQAYLKWVDEGGIPEPADE